MSAFLMEYYLWLKALHLIAVMSWMAGLLYLPRLFVYHCDAAPGSDHSVTLWHVADDLLLLSRCGATVSVTVRIQVIDLVAFSSVYRVCFTCAPEADVPASFGDSAMVQSELPL